LAAGSALSGCSTLAPLNPDVDMQATGAIAASAGAGPGAASKPALPAALDEEDRRRALGALAIALDPQGNGATVRWDNPVSKAHGLVTPVGYAYPQNGLICRKFSARFDTAAGPESQTGAACRDKNADWTLTESRRGE
jgi:surface antigen